MLAKQLYVDCGSILVRQDIISDFVRVRNATDVLQVIQHTELKIYCVYIKHGGKCM